MSKGTFGFVPTLTVKQEEIPPAPPSPPPPIGYVTVPGLWVTMMLTIIVVLAVALLVQTARRQQA